MRRRLLKAVQPVVDDLSRYAHPDSLAAMATRGVGMLIDVRTGAPLTFTAVMFDPLEVIGRGRMNRDADELTEAALAVVGATAVASVGQDLALQLIQAVGEDALSRFAVFVDCRHGGSVYAATLDRDGAVAELGGIGVTPARTH